MPDPKRILVTGGAGFIGSHLVHYLLETYPEYEVTVLDLLTYSGSMDNLPELSAFPQLKFVHGNIRNEELVDTLVAESNIVVHMAAETHVTRSITEAMPFFMTDVIGTQIVTEAVLKHSDTVDRYLYISSSEVYGTAQDELMREDHPLLPRSPYAAAKLGGDRLVYAYLKTHEIPAVIVRPFNNYGPRQHVEKAIPRFIVRCKLGLPLELHGDGSAERDWILATEHCEALDCIMHAERDLVIGEEFNIGAGKGTSIREIAERVCSLMDKAEHPIVCCGERPGNVQCHAADVSKIKRVLGWEAKTPLDEGLLSTIKWYLDNPHHWEKQMDAYLVPVEMGEGGIQWQ